MRILKPEKFPQGPNNGITGVVMQTAPELSLSSNLGYVLRSLYPRINLGLDATGNGEKQRGAQCDSRRRTRLDAAAEKETAAH